jgi:hypothetical protein
MPEINTDLYSGYDYDYPMPTTPMVPNWWDSLPTTGGGDFDFGPPLYEGGGGGSGGGFDPIGDYLRTGGVEGSIVGGGTGGGAGSVGGAGFETFLRNLPNAARSLIGRYLNPRGASGGGGGGVGLGGGLAALAAALMARRDAQRPFGGGVTQAYAGPKQITRTMEQGPYGPIARYAANGGLMRAYAQGGAVEPFPMQDGGFVFTNAAVKNAEKLGGLKKIIPEAQPIVGPGHGTSDSIPAYIQGKHGRTPAAVSNGEMYVPPGRDTKGLYALMKSLERNA